MVENYLFMLQNLCSSMLILIGSLCMVCYWLISIQDCGICSLGSGVLIWGTRVQLNIMVYSAKSEAVQNLCSSLFVLIGSFVWLRFISF